MSKEKEDKYVPRTVHQNKVEGIEYEEEKLHEMTASYSEISMDSQSSPPMSGLNSQNDSPISNKYTEDFKKIGENLSRPTCLELRGSDRFYRNDKNTITYENSIGIPELEGTITKDGDVVSFVAEDLENKIKLSSPISKKDLPFFESRSSISHLYRQAVAPQIPIVDHNILNELESEARKVATSVDALTENLAAILHSASALTVGCLETYRDAVCKTCDAVDYNIKSMYQLMAKCEELSKSMSTVHKMSDRLKDMKKMLDLFESSMN